MVKIYCNERYVEDLQDVKFILFTGLLFAAIGSAIVSFAFKYSYEYENSVLCNTTCTIIDVYVSDDNSQQFTTYSFTPDPTIVHNSSVQIITITFDINHNNNNDNIGKINGTTIPCYYNICDLQPLITRQTVTHCHELSFTVPPLVFSLYYSLLFAFIGITVCVTGISMTLLFLLICTCI